MRNVGGHDEHFACLHVKRLCPYMDFSHAVDNLYDSVERSCMFAELLSFIEGEQALVSIRRICQRDDCPPLGERTISVSAILWNVICASLPS